MSNADKPQRPTPQPQLTPQPPQPPAPPRPTAGVPDYSEVFQFGWSGTYTIRMRILLPGDARFLEAGFTHRHVI